MNTEEIRMLVDLFSSVGEGAYALIIIYFAKGLLTYIIGAFVIIYIVAKLFNTVSRSVNSGKLNSKLIGLIGSYDMGERLTISEAAKERLLAMVKENQDYLATGFKPKEKEK